MSLSCPQLLDDGVVRLRPWRREDVSCVQEASKDPRIPEGTTVPVRCTAEEGEAFIARQHRRLSSGQGVSLAIAQPDDVAVGLVILSVRPQPGVAGIGYWVVPEGRRRGLASRAVALMTGWGLRGGGWARIEAWVEPDNDASRRVLEANDYLLEGRLRSFLTLGGRRADVLVYSRITAGA